MLLMLQAARVLANHRCSRTELGMTPQNYWPPYGAITANTS